jgi:gamma-glutamylcyclotransferase (GGCT)/AIG2-like uncharacterized protein YtfP
MLLHFAYGSNMDRALMRAHCPSAKPFGPATLDNHRFVIAVCGYASVQPRAGSVVFGILWRLTPRDVAALDRHESVATGLYDREMLSVRAREGRTTALTYVARARGAGRPQPGYLELVLAAARVWQLPEGYIGDLARWSGASRRVTA